MTKIMFTFLTLLTFCTAISAAPAPAPAPAPSATDNALCDNSGEFLCDTDGYKLRDDKYYAIRLYQHNQVLTPEIWNNKKYLTSKNIVYTYGYKFCSTTQCNGNYILASNFSIYNENSQALILDTDKHLIFDWANPATLSAKSLGNNTFRFSVTNIGWFILRNNLCTAGVENSTTDIKIQPWRNGSRLSPIQEQRAPAKK